METMTEPHETFKQERQVLRDAMPDICDSPQCLADHGMGPHFPFSWAVHGHSVLARYSCARCGKTWACWWDLGCVSVEAAE
jgi:hypothetical protein